MIQLTLVRHGLSEANIKEVLSGWIDVDLSKQGLQALQEIKDRDIYSKDQMYVSSDLRRCIQTFETLFGDHATLHKRSNQFREIYFGEAEGKSYTDVDPKKYFDDWLNDNLKGSGETYLQFKTRIMNALHDLYVEAKNLLCDTVTLVCHSGVIRLIILELLGLDPKENWHWRVPNGKGYKLNLTYKDDRWQVINHSKVE